MPDTVGFGILPEHSRLREFLADGALHRAQAQIDPSFTEVTFRRPGSPNHLGTMSTDHLSSRFLQNLGNAVQRHDKNSWYSTEILAKNNMVDTNEPMGRSARADQPNVGASSVPHLSVHEKIPSELIVRIKDMAWTLHKNNEARGIYNIAAEIASVVCMPNGDNIGFDRVYPHVKRKITGSPWDIFTGAKKTMTPEPPLVETRSAQNSLLVQHMLGGAQNQRITDAAPALDQGVHSSGPLSFLLGMHPNR
jgi:hypothetical protein